MPPYTEKASIKSASSFLILVKDGMPRLESNCVITVSILRLDGRT